MPASRIVPAPRQCPRCNGRLYATRDWAGTYSSCMICGYVHEWSSPIGIALAEEGTATGARRQRRREPSHGRSRL